ncbi:MAG: transglutaminase family protein [Pirellulales bacterium]
MPIRVALHHKTEYFYDRPIEIYPQVMRLRPAPHTRTPILSYSLKVGPAKHFINWQQDPQGNYQARFVFTEKAKSLSIEVDLIAEMTVINPFDFFVESSAEKFPIQYEPALQRELRPFLEQISDSPLLDQYVASIPLEDKHVVYFLVDLNTKLQKDIGYTIRMEPGVQTCEETLRLRTGSCRDTAWLLVQVLRRLGYAARFVSGYLIQLTPDIKAIDGPVGSDRDFTDLHAWTEVYLPGAGWIGLDPTSGLFAGEGHIPLACTPDPSSAAPVSGGVEPCESTLHHEMTLTRYEEESRITKPYTEEQWTSIVDLGHKIDADLEKHAVRLTMGGEPTFVSVDDQAGDEWNTAAVGPTKRLLSGDLMLRLRNRFAPGGLLHYGQGKWYPGEQLPRWSLACYWRKDGQPLWTRPNLICDEKLDYGHDEETARRFAERLAERLGVEKEFAIPGYEDAWQYMLRERRLPVNVDPLENHIDDELERAVFRGSSNKV